MYTLRSVDIRSCAKMLGAIYCCIGLVMLPFLLLGGLIGLISGQAAQGMLSLILAILAPVLYGVLGFLVGALIAWLYNTIAGWMGGIELELKTRVAHTGSNLGLI